MIVANLLLFIAVFSSATEFQASTNSPMDDDDHVAWCRTRILKFPYFSIVDVKTLVLYYSSDQGKTWIKISEYDPTKVKTLDWTAPCNGLYWIVLQSISQTGEISPSLDQFNWMLKVRVAVRELPQTRPSVFLSAKELAAHWANLAGAGCAKSDAAWYGFAAAWDHAMPFLREKLRLIATPQSEVRRIEGLIANLNSTQFANRENATKELIAAGQPASELLLRMLKDPPSLEAKQRAELVLKRCNPPTTTADQLRAIEAIELLEHLRTAKAIALLEEVEFEASMTAVLPSRGSERLESAPAPAFGSALVLIRARQALDRIATQWMATGLILPHVSRCQFTQLLPAFK
jgi:hypothetical protein